MIFALIHFNNVTCFFYAWGCLKARPQSCTFVLHLGPEQTNQYNDILLNLFLFARVLPSLFSLKIVLQGEWGYLWLRRRYLLFLSRSGLNENVISELKGIHNVFVDLQCINTCNEGLYGLKISNLYDLISLLNRSCVLHNSETKTP